ncbi:DNA topology modulation protein [Paenibacillus crassostreae]|uniref:AAA family ATPase n=1 Tax=Paenibacillus crassostreae TaxID=1763538 RepID=A0A167FTF0_9BACL|nr:DNA topology modulation protein [Paenibacillus crassostreae]AOZ94083.1 AAA family ATPase [Paenibacillus crassostreae]OAB76881.1 AAA family ATPase [Paenibacillus crassostreae]
MKRIMIIGSAGSGKSTFARKIADITKLPLIYLDAYYWKAGWVATSNDDWEVFQQGIVLDNEWIIDGNYNRTLDIRMARADTIIFFDLSPWVTMYRVIKRRIQFHGRTRPDLNEGCPEALDWEFIRLVWNFRKLKRPAILEKLKIFERDKNIIILRSLREVMNLLDDMKNSSVQ